MSRLAPYWKAVVAFLAPGAVVVGIAAQREITGGDPLSSSVWLYAAATCVVTAASVYLAPKNADKKQ
jgi:hypothetical protein